MKRVAELIEGHPIIHAELNATVREVARTMSDRNIGALAILDAGKLVGVFSERDLMKRIVAEGRNPDETIVSSVMTRNLVVAEATDDVNSALQKMHDLNCRHLPVVRDGHLIGMLSLRDLLKVEGDASRARATFLNELVTHSPDYDS